MAFIDTLAPEAADDAVTAMYRRQQAAWGFIPNYAKVFSLRPDVLRCWAELQTQIKRTIDKRRFELVTFAAALELRNSACSLVHGRTLREWFTDAQIIAIAEGRCDTVLSEAEQAVVAFARQTARDATRTTASQVAALKRHGCSDAEIFDIAAVAAGRAFFAKLLDALGTLPDSSLLDLDDRFRQTLTVGRPIDTSDRITMPLPEALDR
jgi:alkylhydroperoxidase family enzyme